MLVTHLRRICSRSGESMSNILIFRCFACRRFSSGTSKYGRNTSNLSALRCAFLPVHANGSYASDRLQNERTLAIHFETSLFLRASACRWLLCVKCVGKQAKPSQMCWRSISVHPSGAYASDMLKKRMKPCQNLWSFAVPSFQRFMVARRRLLRQKICESLLTFVWRFIFSSCWPSWVEHRRRRCQEWVKPCKKFLQVAV